MSFSKGELSLNGTPFLTYLINLIPSKYIKSDECKFIASLSWIALGVNF